MPAPEHVGSRRFPVSSTEVIYDQDGVALAFSTWDRRDLAVGIRWNYQQGGASETGKGFPNQGKYSTWFILSRQTATAMLLGLLQIEFNGKDENRLREIIRVLGNPASD